MEFLCVFFNVQNLVNLFWFTYIGYAIKLLREYNKINFPNVQFCWVRSKLLKTDKKKDKKLPIFAGN
jgi:hypothetical protein